ncbi:adenosylmethionine decarboxylase [Kingella negevensis]|uniref:adenosylmethionine decarboxylase n=1 Tax=Kingella negevensis TaxID=1522312 RepID=UPI0025503DDB|nr:adenosylmethionine decarboxylase [Kingella negevensis]MDK4682084.1 adenosylmethionine decarboxylase [Kingella negevensis]
MSEYHPSQHAFLDLYGCPTHMLTNATTLETSLRQAAEHVGAHILSAHFHTFGGHGGVTGVVLLAESHITVHTWVEHQYAAVDIFLCGSLKPERAAQFLQAALQAQSFEYAEHSRGNRLFNHQ